jgi:hypothetical protein
MRDGMLRVLTKPILNLILQITGHGMVQIYPPFSLKSLAEHFDLRKAFKYQPQVLHYTVSHHISPMAFRKTVGY